MSAWNPSPVVGMQDFTFEVELLRNPAARLGVDLIVAKTADVSLLMVERVGQGGLVEEWNSRTEAPYQVQSGDIILSANGVQGNIAAMSNLLRTAQGILHITVLRKPNPMNQTKAQAQAPVPPVPPPPPREAMLESAVGPMPRTAFGPEESQMNAYVAGLASSAPGLASSAPGMAPQTPQVTQIGPECFTFEVLLRKAAGAFLGIDMLPAPKRPPALIVKQVFQGGAVAAWNHQCNGSAFAIHPGDYIIRVNDVTDDITAFMEEMRAQPELHLTLLRRTKDPAPVVPDAKRMGMQPNLAVPGRPMSNPGVPLPNLSRPPFKAQAQMTMPPGYEGMDLRAAWRDAEAPAPLDEFTFEVEVEKPRGHKLGIDVMLMTAGGRCGLLVGQVAIGGYAHLWNQQSQWPRQIQKNDLIIAANGINARTDLARMAQEFDMDISRVRFTVQRTGAALRSQAGVQAETDPYWARSHAQSVASVTNMAPGNWAKPLATSPVLQDRVEVPPVGYPHRGMAQALGEEETFGIHQGLQRSMALSPQVDSYLEKQIPLPSMAAKMRPHREVLGTGPFPSGLEAKAEAWKVPSMPIQIEDKQAVEAAHAAATATAIAAAVVDESEASTFENEGKTGQSKLPPAKLLLCTLQLNDEDLTTVLQEALAQRPWLAAPVKQAIMEHSTA